MMFGRCNTFCEAGCLCLSSSSCCSFSVICACQSVMLSLSGLKASVMRLTTETCCFSLASLAAFWACSSCSLLTSACNTTTCVMFQRSYYEPLPCKDNSHDSNHDLLAWGVTIGNLQSLWSKSSYCWRICHMLPMMTTAPRPEPWLIEMHKSM